jgi:predicted HicB family RNase H-like nuclease
MNLMTVDGYHAKISYDEETDQFCGEILGLSGGVDFYGSCPEESPRIQKVIGRLSLGL